MVILHEQDIRKEKGHFRFNDRLEKTIFLDELTGIIESNNFILISCVIDKTRLKEKAQTADNPFDVLQRKFFCKQGAMGNAPSRPGPLLRERQLDVCCGLVAQ